MNRDSSSLSLSGRDIVALATSTHHGSGLAAPCSKPLPVFYGGANGKLTGGFCSTSFDFATGYVEIFPEFETINSHIRELFVFYQWLLPLLKGVAILPYGMGRKFHGICLAR